MAGNYVETEVKIRVNDLAEIEQRIAGAGGMLAKPRVYERNVRYDDAAHTLTGAGKVLRLRQDERIRLTYKEPMEGMSRTELEVTVSDFDTADLLLRRLGYSPVWLYEKYRTTYTLAGCEIVLDELPFGAFIEIEGEPGAIEQAIAALGLAAAPRIVASYSELFARLKERLGLDFRDLTFENFKGVALSESGS